MKKIGEAIKQFFAVDNGVNEDTVMGAIFAVVLIIATFTGVVDGEKYYILAGMTSLFFGIGAFKK